MNKIDEIAQVYLNDLEAEFQKMIGFLDTIDVALETEESPD